MFFLVICLITFILTTNTLFLLANRIIFGIFQSYVFIYFPLWCNQYGITNKSSIMLSFGQLTFPIGVLLGYVIGSICITINKDNGWKYSFVIQSIVVFIMIIPFFYAPESVFEVKYESFQDSNRNNNKILFRISSTIIEEIDTDENMNNILKVATISKKELFEILKKIMKQKIFISSVFALSCLYFCITGLQYWGSDYMNRVLRVHSPERRLLYFSLICFSSPTIGVILGGYILNYLQGFENKKVFDLCFILSILTFINAILSLLSQNIIFFVIFACIAFLIGGAIMPILTGIVITSLPLNLSASGNSFQLFIGTLFGFLPAPYIYGAIQDIFKDGGRRSMIFNMAYFSICVILLGYNRHLKYHSHSLVDLDFIQELKIDNDL